MRLFWEIALRSFRRHLTYRAAAIAGLITNFGFGWLRVSVLLALYDGRSAVEGITQNDLYAYVALTQAVITYLGIFGWYDLMNSVYTGEVGTDLLKPMSFFNFWLAQDAGRAAVAVLLRGVLIMIFFGLVFPMSYPASVAQWVWLATAVLLSWLVSFTYRFLINLAAFWTPNAKGISRFAFIFAMFFSGFLMPLRLYPDWVQTVAQWTPFPHMLNTVMELYLGLLQGPALIQALLTQAAWVLILAVLGQMLLRTAVRRLVILGG
ncbi:ABC transporter permease [Candidatus Leptofilum sp.]|uniref:ABC transporter permease n=1 Tax=Candidatus Leptofilum sp. TaxID=3241576 RepID=UPI003B58C91F